MVRYPRSTLVSLFEFGVGAEANLGVVVHLGGNDLGQLKGMELILWIFDVSAASGPVCSWCGQT